RRARYTRALPPPGSAPLRLSASGVRIHLPLRHGEGSVGRRPARAQYRSRWWTDGGVGLEGDGGERCARVLQRLAWLRDLSYAHAAMAAFADGKMEAYVGPPELGAADNLETV